MPHLAAALLAAADRLPPAVRDAAPRLWRAEHLGTLAARLAHFHRSGGPTDRPPPHFAAEVTPPLGLVFDPFAPLAPSAEAGEDVADELAAALVAVGVDGVLLLLGQRRTPASLTNGRAVPPDRATLAASAAAPFAPGEALSDAARALAKHAGRNPLDRFWGKPKGPPAAQNVDADVVVARILDAQTWWNVFGHFDHDTVYEARLPSGHGARWGRGGAEFIGFLEPFDESKCPSLAVS